MSIHVSDLARAKAFWVWFLGQLGYEQFETWKDGVSYKRASTYIDFIQVEDEYRTISHDRERPGMHHMAFHASGREMVDQITTGIRRRGLKVFYEDKHPYAGGSSYYALYFEDSDGIKVELVSPE